MITNATSSLRVDNQRLDSFPHWFEDNRSALQAHWYSIGGTEHSAAFWAWAHVQQDIARARLQAAA